MSERPKPKSLSPIAIVQIWPELLEALDNGGLEDESVFHPINDGPKVKAETGKGGGASLKQEPERL